MRYYRSRRKINYVLLTYVLALLQCCRQTKQKDIQTAQTKVVSVSAMNVCGASSNMARRVLNFGTKYAELFGARPEPVCIRGRKGTPPYPVGG
jgi:hypothetical protein